MKYRLQRETTRAPERARALVGARLSTFERRYGPVVSGGKGRLYEMATEPEPLKCRLVEMTAHDRWDLWATSDGGRLVETASEAVQRLERQGDALSDLRAKPRQSCSPVIGYVRSTSRPRPRYLLPKG